MFKIFKNDLNKNCLFFVFLFSFIPFIPSILVNHFSFNHACALITGASSGLGAEFARQLAPHASTLILVARRRERLEGLAEELQKKYPHLKIHVKVHDLISSQEREQLAAWVREEKLPLTLVINNAGLGDLGDFFDASWQRLEEIIGLNVTALTHLTHLFLPTLREQAPSALLQVGSIAGFFPLPQNAIYAASKAYVRSFSQALHVEEKEHGVMVTLLCPGPVPTEFFNVASRPEQLISVTTRAPSFLITSEKKVVFVALNALLHGKSLVIPNNPLANIVGFFRLIPFSLFQNFLPNKKR